MEIEVSNSLHNPWNIGNWIFKFSHLLEILEISCFYIFGFFQKRCAPKFHAGCTDGWAEISHMRPIQARKLKLFQTWISKWRRRRRRPNNSPIWPEPWTITPRDQISRSGSIPHFDLYQLRFGNNSQFFRDFNWKSPIFSKSYIKIYVFVRNLVRIGSGIVGNVFTTFVLLWNHPAGAFFWPKSQFSEILDMVIFQKMSFRQKLDFWVTNLS